MCCKFSYRWESRFINPRHLAVCICACIDVHFGHGLMHPTDGTVCNELICDNYLACWGKLKKMDPVEFYRVDVWRDMSACYCVNGAATSSQMKEEVDMFPAKCTPFIHLTFHRLSICYYSILSEGRSMRQVCLLLGPKRSCRLCLWFTYSSAPMEKKLVWEILIVLTDLQSRLEMNSCLPTPLSNTVRLSLSGREASNTCLSNGSITLHVRFLRLVWILVT